MAQTLSEGVVVPVGDDRISLTGVDEMRALGATVNAALKAAAEARAQTAAALDAKVDSTDPRLSDARTPKAHGHTQADIEGLSSTLGGKADKSHEHAQADVSGLVDALAAKVPVKRVPLTGAGLDLNAYTSDMYAVIPSNSWVTQGQNFPTATAGILDVSVSPTGMVWQFYRTYSTSDPQWWIRNWWQSWGPWRQIITSADPRLSDARTPKAHNHTISDVGGLQAALNARATTTAVDAVSADLSDVRASLDGITSAYDLWLAQGNTGTVEDYFAAQKGEQGTQGPYGGTEVTDPQVAQLMSTATATRDALDARARRALSPLDFGATGNGVSDDTSAVRAAITDGRPVHWGSGIYRITEPIEHTATSAVRWLSDGATILVDLPAPTEYAVTIHADGHPVTLDGRLLIDAQRTAHTCLRVWNRAAYTTITLTDLTVARAYRTDASLKGGDGLEIGGAWDRITLTRPTVRDISMAPGAGVAGSMGSCGIYIHEISKGDGYYDSPRLVTITDIDVDGVRSDDPDYQADQDALRIFGTPETPGAPMRTRFVVRGGRIRNAAGRSVKAQTPHALVEGVEFVRDGIGAGFAHEIDFQVGGGTVRDCSFTYRDAAPVSCVNFSGQREGALVEQSTISGLHITMSGTVLLDRIVSVVAYQETEKHVAIASVVHKGSQPACGVALVGTVGAIHAVLTGWSGSMSTSLVRASGGTSWRAIVVASGCVQVGAAVPLAVAASSSITVTASRGALHGLT